MKQPIPRRILLLAGLLVFLNLFDAGATTYLILTGFGYEINPIMAWLIDLGIGWFLLYKVFCGTAVAVFFAKFHNFKLARMALWVVLIPYIVLFVYYVVGFIWLWPLS
jgi:hypothetical protein